MGIRIIKWYGPEIVEKMLKAAEAGLDETAAAAVARAKANLASAAGPYYTGDLEADIQVIEAAQSGKRRSWVHWGAPDSDHALWQEIGANGEPGKHFFRAAADAEYPKLASRIKQHLG